MVKVYVHLVQLASEKPYYRVQAYMKKRDALSSRDSYNDIERQVKQRGKKFVLTNKIRTIDF